MNYVPCPHCYVALKEVVEGHMVKARTAPYKKTTEAKVHCLLCDAHQIAQLHWDDLMRGCVRADAILHGTHKEVREDVVAAYRLDGLATALELVAQLTAEGQSITVQRVGEWTMTVEIG